MVIDAVEGTTPVTEMPAQSAVETSIFLKMRSALDRLTSQNNGNRSEAEKQLVTKGAELCDSLKSEAGDFVAADVASAVVLGTMAQSENPTQFSRVAIEGGESDWFNYQVVRVETAENGNVNIPRMMVKDTLVRRFADKFGLTLDSQQEHDRIFSDDPEIAQKLTEVYNTLASEFDGMDLKGLCREVLDFSRYEDETMRWQAIDSFIDSLGQYPSMNQEQKIAYVQNRMGSQFSAP